MSIDTNTANFGIPIRWILSWMKFLGTKWLPRSAEVIYLPWKLCFLHWRIRFIFPSPNSGRVASRSVVSKRRGCASCVLGLSLWERGLRGGVCKYLHRRGAWVPEMKGFHDAGGTDARYCPARPLMVRSGRPIAQLA